jgi:fumarylacetoacetase
MNDFTIHNLPFGIFSTKKSSPRVGIAFGNQILDLVAAHKAGFLTYIDKKVFTQPYLNDLIALGKTATNRVRLDVQKLLSEKDSPLLQTKRLWVKQSLATMHLPVKIGDYTDFYSSIEHATNVGIMFRDPANALLPNWKHIPVGYHGRASSIVVSGTPINRPSGQIVPKGEELPVFQATKSLDFELEVGFIIGKNSEMGIPISTKEANDYIFGMVLFNDWSARDIQKWEYVPLGPFLGKNFASSISPWVVLMEALEPFKVQGPKQEDPTPLPYLHFEGFQNYDINLEVSITPEKGTENVVSRSNFKFMYWNISQQLAHHTCNGCNVNLGDLMASGTISGKEVTSFGSMLELAWSGSKPIPMNDGSTRVFINDGDTVTMRGYAEKGDIRVGFGAVENLIIK